MTTKGTVTLETAKKTFPFLMELYETQIEFHKTLAQSVPGREATSLEDKFAEVVIDTLNTGKVSKSCPNEATKIIQRTHQLIEELKKKGKEVIREEGAVFAATCAKLINDDFIRKHQLHQ